MKANGRLSTDLIEIIPFILYLSDSKVQGNDLKTVGRAFTLHITPFFAMGVIIPKFLYNGKEKGDK